MKTQDNLSAPHAEDQSRPKVAIIVLNWNGWRDTIECLEYLQALTYANYHIVVVDNGSADQSVERIKDWAGGRLPIESTFLPYDATAKPVCWVEYDRVTAEAGGRAEDEGTLAAECPGRRMTLIQTGENLGFAEGCNVGIRYALCTDARYVLLWNNDAVSAEAGVLDRMVDAAESSARIGVVGGKICYYSEPDTLWYAGGHISRAGMGVGSVFLGWNQRDDGQFDKAGPTGFVTGCIMLIKCEVLDKVGLLDARLFFGVEDADYCLRASKEGWGMYYVPQAKFYHKIARSYDKYDPQMLYHMYSGKILFMKKHLRGWEWQFWRAAFLGYLLLIAIPKLTIATYRSTGHWRLLSIAQSSFQAYREHATTWR